MTESMAQCISKIRIKQKDNNWVDVPCGRCNFCLQNRRKEWSFRLQRELRQHSSAFFLTLTYSDEHLPWVDIEGEEFPQPSLDKSDFQKFMKRLRKAQSKLTTKKIKYYAVGEYGSSTRRPHYHAIVFSLLPGLASMIEEIWSLGHVKVGTVTDDSIDYVTKYVINRYDFADYAVPPFSLISNGIGLDHLIQNKNRYANETVVVGNRGYPQSVPRYYRNKLGESKFTQAIAAAKSRALFEQREREELERLAKLHPDPHAYIEERKLASHDRITKRTKKGDVL